MWERTSGDCVAEALGEDARVDEELAVELGVLVVLDSVGWEVATCVEVADDSPAWVDSALDSVGFADSAA